MVLDGPHTSKHKDWKLANTAGCGIFKFNNQVWSIKQSNPVLFSKWYFSADPLYRKGYDFSMSSGHLFFCIARVHNQTLSSQNLQPKKAQVSPAPALCSTLSPDETAFNSFIFFCLTHSHPSFFVLPIQALFIFPFLLSPLHSPKFTCIPPIPLSKPFYHAEAACWFLPDTNSLPFIEKCSLSLSHECTVLIASSMQLSLQSHKWKCFVGRCTSHISLKRKSEG